MMTINEVMDPRTKAEVCEGILRALPDWFGVEEAIADYTADSRDLPLFAAQDGELIVGFIAVKIHNKYTAQVHVMGVRSDYHRRGIGRELIARCERFCDERGIEYLTVKTLDELNPDPGYARTREFYLSMGFRPLEVFPTIWDEANPCLLMAKHLTCA